MPSTCPPCTGACDQGRGCPARFAPALTDPERERLARRWARIDRALPWATLVLILGLATISRCMAPIA